MDFVIGLPRTPKKNDAIWVIVDRLTKSAHFLPIRWGSTLEQLAKEYINKIVRLHGIPVSIVMLRRYRSDPSHVLQNQPIEIKENLSYIEEPIQILDFKVKKMRNRDIPSVKVLWGNHSRNEATWETEENMRITYPFVS